jgi:tetratricopeptide (TPR) repeat protein
MRGHEEDARVASPSVKRFQRTLGGYPRSPRLLASLAKCLASEGRLEDSLECILASLELDPAQPLLLLRAADSFAILGRVEEAVRFYEHYQSLRPSSPRGYARMGDCLLRAGYVWSAADAYSRALARSQESAGLKQRVREVMRLCAGARS